MPIKANKKDTSDQYGPHFPQKLIPIHDERTAIINKNTKTKTNDSIFFPI